MGLARFGAMSAYSRKRTCPAALKSPLCAKSGHSDKLFYSSTNIRFSLKAAHVSGVTSKTLR
jgi:hypothetical protein